MAVALGVSGVPGTEAGIAWQMVESADQLKVGDVVKEGRRWALEGDPDGFIGRIHAIGSTIISARNEKDRPIKAIVERPGSFIIEFIESDGSSAGLGAFTGQELGIEPYPTYTVPGVTEGETHTIIAQGNRYLEMAVAIGKPAVSE